MGKPVAPSNAPRRGATSHTPTGKPVARPAGSMLWLLCSGCLPLLVAAVPLEAAELVMKILIVNPSDTEVKEFDIRNPLPTEVKPEHVLNADGLRVEYDPQGSTCVLVGTVTLKPKEAVTKRILLEDVWVIDPGRCAALRQETQQILKKLEGTPYLEQGQLVARAIEQTIIDVEASQREPFYHPLQHITRYREDTKKLEQVESDLVSLRQLMVMAALNPSHTPVSALSGAAGASSQNKKGMMERGSLSILTTWRLIFVILALLGGISLSFFMVWQRQLKLQLAQQASTESAESSATPTSGNGTQPLRGAPTPPTPPLQPKVPFSP